MRSVRFVAVLLFLFVGLFGAAQNASAWWNDEWAFRKEPEVGALAGRQPRKVCRILEAVRQRDHHGAMLVGVDRLAERSESPFTEEMEAVVEQQEAGLGVLDERGIELRSWSETREPLRAFRTEAEVGGECIRRRCAAASDPAPPPREAVAPNLGGDLPQ